VKLKNNGQMFFITAILILYIITRLFKISIMGEYFDYDEGTYLMIAHLINNGYLPYRDIFAVHPPLYYYLLALWLRILGDTYIIGRLFSVFLGLISILVAYFTGREIRDWKLGALFASLLVCDPLMIYMNSRVLHETIVELFTLFALYFFIKYVKTKNLRYAYFSLFLAGLGSTAKFTIIPFLVALYLTIILSLDEKSWQYFEGMVDSIFNSKQILIVLLTYLIATLAVISIVIAYPKHIIRLLVIVPGIHPVDLVGHKYTSALFLLLWIVLTIYILDLSYVRKLIETLKILLRNWKLEIKLGLVILVAKAIVEVPFGIFISGNYIAQTYISQGGRYLPFLGFFSLMNKIFKNLSNGSPEFMVYLSPLLLLFTWVVLTLSKGYKLRGEKHLSGLLLLNIFMFLFLIPIPPSERFIYPMFLVAYLTALYSLLSIELPRKKIIVGGIISLLVFSAIDYGLLVNYPAGRLKLAWGEHTDDMRHDLQIYLENSSKPRLCMSINPMNAYYLHLTIDPHLLDTFGLAYLKRENPEFILERMKNENITCTILSTWMYAIMQKDKTLKATYSSIQNYSLMHGILRFSESYSTGEVLEFFTLSKTTKNLSISTHYGKLYFWVNGIEIGKLYFEHGNTSFNARTLLELKKANFMYIMRSWSRNGRKIEGHIETRKKIVEIEIPKNSTAVLEFSGVTIKKNGEPLKAGETVSIVYLYTHDMRLLISSGNISRDKEKLLITGHEIVLKYGDDQ